jgi:threonine/homoserine/homoserine lactone efflux protein
MGAMGVHLWAFVPIAAAIDGVTGVVLVGLGIRLALERR